MTTALKKLGVEIILDTEATPRLVREYSPTGVFVAVGATPIIPGLPGLSKIDEENIFTAEAVIQGAAKPSGRVIIIGTGLTGLETAELLTNKGCDITLVEMQNDLGPGLFSVIRNDIMSRIQKHDPTILTSHKLTGVLPVGSSLKVSMQSGSGDEVADADAVVLALGVRPRADIVEAFEDEFGAASVFAIGDAAKGGRIYEAVRDGFDRAFVFDPQV
jgi:pyruvate/2-oxoglutarate dehydrogenase complex dihydrolipoamide dehydrogenase (E3) component